MRDAFAFDFVHVCSDVDCSFLAQEAGEFLVKPPVVRREALVCYLFAGQVHPNSMEASAQFVSLMLRSDQKRRTQITQSNNDVQNIIIAYVIVIEMF